MYTITQDKNYLITGYVARDAECKTTKNGKTYVQWSVAVGKRGEDTVWTNCKAWGDAADAAAGIRRGDTVLCVGRLDSHEYNGKTYKELVCEFVLTMVKPVRPEAPAPGPAEDLHAEDDLSDFEALLGGNEAVPF